MKEMLFNLLATMDALQQNEGQPDWWSLLAFGGGTLLFCVLLSVQLYQCRKDDASKKDVYKALAVYGVIYVWMDIEMFVLSTIFGWTPVESAVIFLVGALIVWLPGKRYVKRVIDFDKLKHWPFF